jgi:hypothetical protein
MKRGIVLIVMLLLLVDVAWDGYCGNVNSGPLRAAVTHDHVDPPHYHPRQVGSSHLLPSSDWRDLFSSRPIERAIPLGQFSLKIVTSCNNGGSGGKPR